MVDKTDMDNLSTILNVLQQEYNYNVLYRAFY